MAMFINKRIEAYVEFAQFCKRYNIPAFQVGEAVQLVSDLKKTPNTKFGDAKRKKREQLTELLTSLGFQQVRFSDDDNPTFIDKLHDECRLPNII